MKGMSLEVSTDILQYLVIALITESNEKTSIMPKDKYEEMVNALMEMNKMCSAENNYTLSVEVTA